MREQALLQPADEHTVKLQPFAGVHRHQLHGILPSLGLVVARLQRGVGQKRHQRALGFAGFGIGCGFKGVSLQGGQVLIACLR